jgi:hypothetical protein
MRAEEKAKEYLLGSGAMTYCEIESEGLINEAREEAFIAGANWQASQHEWVKTSDRLPTEADAVDGMVEFLWWNEVGQHYEFIKLKVIFFIRSVQIPVDYWRTPLSNNFPEPPKTEI